jgi:hypothetical protein
VYAPSARVVVPRVAPDALLRAVTRAASSAPPLAARTTPAMRPDGSWACAVGIDSSIDSSVTNMTTTSSRS